MHRTAQARPLLHVISGVMRVVNGLGLHRRTLMALDLEVLDAHTRAQMAGGHDNESAFALYASPFLDLKTTPTGSYFRDLLAVTARMPPFETIRAPVLALLSAHSTFTNPPKTRRALEAFPNVEIVELHTRHWIPTEQPREMREAIENWLKGQTP